MKMKKLTSLCGCLLLSMCMGVGAMTAPLSAEAAAREKVILDADMVDLFDDGIAMMMLAESPKMDLKGVTIVIGNTWVETGTASAIRQLEGIGRTDIPVYMGVNETVRKDRFANMKEEKRIFGRGHDSHLGAAGYPQPASWQAEYRKNYNDEPVMSPQKQHAADFIIDTIKKHPGEVTIVAIGSGANLAAALDKAPEIAPLAKRVVYMAGAFFCEGNVMPTSEFNVWIDPETAKKAYRAPWKEQIFLPLDVCSKELMSHNDFKDLESRIKSDRFKAMWESHYATPMFRTANSLLTDNRLIRNSRNLLLRRRPHLPPLRQQHRQQMPGPAAVALPTPVSSALTAAARSLSRNRQRAAGPAAVALPIPVSSVLTAAARSRKTNRQRMAGPAAAAL